MPDHKGMRPQDVLVLLKLASYERQGVHAWQQQPTAAALGISQSELSASLQRSRVARLVSEDKQRIYPQAVREFLCYGLRYVFPAEPGAVRRGWPTAHSAAPLGQLIRDTDPYVWASADGPARGAVIVPLYPSVPYAAQQDETLYELLALADTLRVGRPREIALAQELLTERLPQ